MTTQDQIRQYFEQYADTAVSFNQYALKKTGIVPGQTVLKMETYNLVCMPWQATMRSVTLLLSLTREELVFFSRFKNAHAGLTIVFQLPTSPKPLQIFSRCVVKSIDQVRGRDSVGLVTVEFKPIPQDMIAIFGEYILSLERLKAEYDDFRDKPIRITPESAKAMGFNNYAVFSDGKTQSKLALYDLASNRTSALLPPQSADVPPGTKGAIKLYFQKYQFSAGAVVSEWARLPSGVVKAGFSLDFAPELIEILEQYNFTARLAAKRSAPPA